MSPKKPKPNAQKMLIIIHECDQESMNGVSCEGDELSEPEPKMYIY